jgi:hypothetical protein
MSQEDLWKAIGRARMDPAFLEEVARDPVVALGAEGLVLDQRELEAFQLVLIGGGQQDSEMRFQQEMAHKHLAAQFERGRDLGRYTVQILKDTLDTARQTYRVIKWMTIMMFSTGLALFAAAGIVGLVTDDAKDALIFGGLGGAAFAALFLTGPIDKSQDALSNLVQAEVLFMNYFEQITFWENYAFRQEGTPPGPSKANIEKASSALQERTNQTSQLLQKYVETKGG